ncbi:hypothetical protein BH708_04975 [Brachybacterium sp. P6-10-X1]|uniref:GyrI-like domain-containing protein n=1 Tax=Brachybacterium sp. P6-10-X1 TaxID=1903186 RepID=UPI0009717DD5|nr:GyrI-like domain-containing protein [Brachybacterium sp. P6-10-X1]APX32185.1 hypothetical protein BH708_04975 [Brachybacterium sp. P6-10-X1]
MSDPATYDVKKELDSYRARRGRFRTLEVPARRFLMIDGEGDPNTSPEYEAALSQLYPLAYSVKFRSKRELGRDYVVPPLEGLWWAEDMEAFTSARDKSRWHWRLLLMTPPWIEGDLVETSGDVRWEEFGEGHCIQTLHVGPYEQEGPVLETMHHEEIPARGLALRGTHHEIYLGDPRRAAPEKLRTILRQPVRNREAPYSGPH